MKGQFNLTFHDSAVDMKTHACTQKARGGKT